MKKQKKQCKGKKSKDVFSMVIFLFGIVLLIFSGWKLYGILSDYHESNVLYQELEDTYVTKTAPQEADTMEEEEVQEEQTMWYKMISVDFDGLLEQNPDVAGWIFFENEDISYPILYSGDNSSYLRTAMDHTPATAGCIFIEGANHPDFQDSHTIIYGHNMHNLSMFGKLKYYKEDGYYQDHMYFQIHTPHAIYRYQIFAYRDVPEDSSIYTVGYTPSDEFGALIDEMYSSSYVDTGVCATQEDKIITLSTCSTTGNRFVLHAVRVGTYSY